MANEFVTRNGVISKANATISGSLIVSGSSHQITGSLNISGSLTISGSFAITGSITGSLSGSFSGSASGSFYGVHTGSLFGTASQAITASWALASPGGGAAFPYTGSAQITGSLNITGSLSASIAIFSGSGNKIVSIYGSGSASPIFQIQGSQGQLFAVNDSLSGSLFKVSDISGLQQFEVFSDGSNLFGAYLSRAISTTYKITSSLSGTNVIYNLATSSYDGAFINYIIKSGSNARIGNFTTTWSGSTTIYTDNSGSSSIGNTSGFTFGSSIVGPYAVITGSSSTSGWLVKTIIYGI